ncbi:MAG TPA: transglutaminase domain-containing protein, partial [Pirellulaceae bacterium]|nr:transglutaminase domain-containing protein [Pirellulaceae bacterium]
RLPYNQNQGDPESRPQHFRWKVGAKVTGGSARSQDVIVVLPVPTDWPEQRVELIDQQVSPQFQNFSFRTVVPGATQVVARTPVLTPNQELEIVLTFSVEVTPISVPTDTDALRVPQRIGKELKPFLENTREVSYRNSKLTDLVRTTVDREQPAWDQVRVVFDWVRENIESLDQAPTDTIDCFTKRQGSPEDIVGLFVAMCRSIKIPARMVWVEGTQYAEFYLVNEQEEGQWYPAHVLGLAELGSLPEPRVILQKGDSIKVPEKELPLRFIPEFGRAKSSAPLQMSFSQELLPGR